MFSHSSSSHSLLLSNKEEITVKIKNKNPSSSQIFVDGKNLKYTNNGLKVINTKKLFKLFHPRDYNYFEACRSKLGWALPIEDFKMINLKITFKFIFILFLIFLSSFVSNQNIDDLEYLIFFQNPKLNQLLKG